ncbi:tetratricopeptide repeat protein [Leptolyngbya sp. GB1-A1]|uniref:tetratricopeptide repeat protein n=1 Tax=Leptolyngbya sp. GB1-A1 TaxID=2933908 RepID=UPI003299525D
MEPLPFILWLLFITLIFAFGLGSMVRAYRGRGSLEIIFAEAICPTPPPILNEEAALQFEKGCTAFGANQYRQAIDCFRRAIQLDPGFAEAYHNRGRATANLRQLNEAIGDLLQASEQYLAQDNVAGFDRVRQDLETLKARSQTSAKSNE